MFVAVSNPYGSFIDKPIHLTNPANLFLLSPGGLWVGRGAEFTRAANILLSTGFSLDLPGGRFHATSSHSESLAGLNSSPVFPFGIPTDTSDVTPIMFGTSDAPLVIDRAMISGVQGVQLDASMGQLRMSDSQINARKSLRMSGGKIQILKTGLNAGSSGKRGIIEINSSSNVANGGGTVELVGTRLTGSNVIAAAGNLSLKDVQITAPKGWVDLYARQSVDKEANLRLVDSQIDLAPSLPADIWSPQMIYHQRDNANAEAKRNPSPHIGLYSAGGILVKNSSLNASILISDSSEPSPPRTLTALPAKAGIIRVESAGNINVSQSSLRADATHTMSGGIYMEAGSGLFEKPFLGAVNIADSFLSASGGAGYGLILLRSNNGLLVKGSKLQSVVDRYPLLDSDKFEFTDAYAFRGGRVTLYNGSSELPLEIAASSLLVNHHTSGGSLRSPFYGTDARGSQFVSFGDEVAALNKGYLYSFAGGFIQLYSQGGVLIGDNSLLDASSRNPLTNRMEGLGGQIVVANSGSADVHIRNSKLEARSGDSLGIYPWNLKAGSVYIVGDGDVSLRDVSIDLTASSQTNSQNVDFPDPYLVVKSGGTLRVSGDSSILVRSSSSLPGSSSSAIEPYAYGIRLSDKSIQALGPEDPASRPELMRANVWPGGPYEIGFLEDLRRIASDTVRFDRVPFILRDDGYPTDALFSYFDELITENRKYFLNIYNASRATESGLDSAESFTAPPPLLTVEPPLKLGQTVGLIPPILNPDQDAGNQLLEGQQQSLSDVVESLGLPPGSGSVHSVEELQQHLRRIAGLRRTALEDRKFASDTFYRPAIVQLALAELPGNLVQVTVILLTGSGQPVSRSTVLPEDRFHAAIRAIQMQMARRQIQQDDAPDSPASLLASWLLGPLAEPLRASGANALLLAVDRGLQTIPYSVLPFGMQPLAQNFALTISPSLGLLDLDSRVNNAPFRLLAIGASTFAQPLDPLPMVPREVQALADELPTTVLLDDAFTLDALRQQAAQERHSMVHIATHADFQPGQSDGGRLFTRQGSLSLAELGASLRTRSEARPLDLITLSACHTALGDEQSELGFVGMALQAGARSALGSLWEVDDAAAAAFFVQYYRYLYAGLGKDQALQATVSAFRFGRVRLQGDSLVGPRVRGDGDAPLVAVTGAEQRERLAAGLSHPYFWAGMVLTGSPW